MKTWLDVDAVRAYLARGGGRKPSRKAIYGLVKRGLRVSWSVEEPTRDSKGRLRRGKFETCTEWVDAYFEQRAQQARPTPTATTTTVVSLRGVHRAS